MSLYVSLATVSTTSVGLIGTVFGMNLKSGLEQHPTAFFVVASMILTAYPLIFTIAFTYARRLLHKK